MQGIPKSHPRYESLMQRERIAAAVREGLAHETGLIAHGRGEAGGEGHFSPVEVDGDAGHDPNAWRSQFRCQRGVGAAHILQGLIQGVPPGTDLVLPSGQFGQVGEEDDRHLCHRERYLLYFLGFLG